MNPCPSTEQLRQLLAEQLNDADRDGVETHVEGCAACQSTLEELTGALVPAGERREGQAEGWSRHEPDSGFLRRLVPRSPKAPAAQGGMGGEDTALSPGPAATRTDAESWPQVPGYEILGVLGRGGMSVVYQARQRRLNRLVALKMIRAGEQDDPELLARFRREAEAVAQLAHPNIVQIHEVGERDGRPYFSLEFVAGGTLAQKLAGAPLPPRQAAGLAERLARAMHAAHRRGIIHRDLKPSNVLLAGGDPATGEAGPGEPKITDFGLAKQLDADDGRTRTGIVMGTPGYMAPEQAGGRVKDIGPAADVYALGAVLYEMLTGRPPFLGETTLDTLALVRSQEPVPPSRLQPKVPRDLETICLKCLAKEPWQRYTSAEALAEDLRRFLAGEPIVARPSGLLARVTKWARRRPAVAALILVTAVAVLAVGGVIAGLFYNARLQEAKDRLQEAKDRAEAAVAEAKKFEYSYRIARASAEWHDGNVAQVESQLDACPADRRGWEWHYLKRLCHLDLLTLTGHTNAVAAVAVSPDGTRIASASWDRTVKVWDLHGARAGTGMAPALKLTGHAAQVWGVAFSPDGTRLASGGWDKTIKLWDLKTGRESFELKGHPDWISSVAFSPDGTRLVSSGRRSSVKVWDLKTRELLADLDVPRVAGTLVDGVAFSPDGKLLAAACPDRTVKLWRSEPGHEGKAYTLVGSLPSNTLALAQVAFSPDGTRIAVASWDGTIKVWDLAPSPYRLPRKGEGRVRKRLEFDEDTPVHTLKGHSGPVFGVTFSPDGARLVSGSGDGTVKVWDLRAVREDVADSSILTFKGHTSEVHSVACTPDGTRIISGSLDNTVKVWDSTLPQECQTWKGHTHSVMSVAFSPDESRLASTGRDGLIKTWDTTTGHELPSFAAQPEQLFGVAFSPDGRRLASSSKDGTIKIWNAATGQEITRFLGHTEEVHMVAFSPDGTRLASASDDGTAKIWDVETGRVIHDLKGHKDWVRGVAFSPDGTCLAAGFAQVVKIWDTRSGEELHELSGHDGLVGTVAFSPDGTKLASASRDTTVRIWDVTPGRTGAPKPIFTLNGHKSAVYSLSFSPDGSRLASGGQDNTVRIWDVTTGQEALCLKGHTGVVWGVPFFGPSGAKLASASQDKTIKIWDATPLTAESAVEREAIGLLAGLFGRPLCKADVLDFIKATPTLRPEVQQRALALVNLYREEGNADRYHQTAWDIVRRPYLNTQQYRLALRQAETACRLAPGADKYTITRGVALYRDGQYREARATLRAAHTDVPAVLAFLAMAQHRLDESRQAQETLARLRESMKQPAWAKDAEAQVLLREAEALLMSSGE
jgi:WD40 repeat protein/tRNA A-37 threonylcarbamoyl transferase component Bud32